MATSVYSMDKLMHFLTHALVIVPLNTDDWQRVTDEHAAVYPETNCNISSIKHNVDSLIKLTGPLGNPNCPHDVKLAKKGHACHHPWSLEDKDKDDDITTNDKDNW